MADLPALSYVIPAHNSVDTIQRTLQELDEHLVGRAAEILVVENGSSDGTLELVRSLERDWAGSSQLRLLTCERGLGRALRCGILASTGKRIFLGADDLPFGFSDLERALALGAEAPPVVIGSKAHRESVVNRSLLRTVLTGGFRILRRILLGMRTGDPQGTFILDGAWARDVASTLHEPGFLFTTELAYVAERSGILPLEVPVALRSDHAAHGSRVRPSDVWQMGVGVFALRRRRWRR